MSRFMQQLLRMLICFSLCGGVWASTPSSDELYLAALRAVSENRISDAKAILSQLIEIEPQHAGAWMDLAIIQCELGNAKEAEELFKNIIEKFNPAPVAFVAEIAKYRKHGCRINRNRQVNSHFSVLLDRGFDSNVNQGASNPNFSIGSGATQINLPLLPEYLPKKDHFTALAADYMRELVPGSTIGIVQLRTRAFDDLSKFNTLAIGAGLEHPWRVGNWNVNSMAMLSRLSLNQHLYQKQQLLQTRITLPLPLPDTMQLSSIGSVTRTQYPTLSGYDATTWEWRNLLTYQKNVYRIQAALAYLSDVANSGRIGGDRAGIQTTIQIKKKLNSSINAELGWTYQHWQSELPYSPGLINQARNQHTQTFRGALNFTFDENHHVQIELRQVRNRENISLFEFNSRALQVSWLWQKF